MTEHLPFKRNWFTFLLVLCATLILAACDGGQVCGADDPSRCILNENSESNIVPKNDDDHGKTIADKYIDTLKQLEIEFTYEFDQTDKPFGNSNDFLMVYSYKSGPIEVSNGQVDALSNTFYGLKSAIKKIFQGLNNLEPNIVVTINEQGFPSIPNNELKGFATYIIPVDALLHNSLTADYSSNRASGTAGGKMTISFPNNIPVAEQTIQQFYGTGVLSSPTGWRASTSPNGMTVQYSVVPQGEHNRFQMKHISGNDGYLRFKLIKSGVAVLTKEKIFTINSTNINSLNTAVTTFLEEMFTDLGCSEATVNSSGTSPNYTFTINNVCPDFMALQIWGIKPDILFAAPVQITIDLVDDAGDTFQPITYNAVDPTPIVTMNLIPRQIAPK